VSSCQLASAARLWLRRCLAGAVMMVVVAVRAENCPTPADEIATDRPDVTNSSRVVPVGSLQTESGINLGARDGGRTVDGTNSRWRLGSAPCLEVLVDLPTDFATVKAPGSSGFSDVAPAVKWQISPVPGKIDLSMTAGVALTAFSASDILCRPGPSQFVRGAHGMVDQAAASGPALWKLGRRPCGCLRTTRATQDC
jgi:hypothetical protein